MNDRLRASDADRDRAAAQLQVHFAAGRLTRDELDVRLAAALPRRPSLTCAEPWRTSPSRRR